MCVLGLDLGARRIGLAVSDPERRIALPVGALERRGLSHDLEALRELAAERGVDHIVIGLPLHLDGREGTGAKAARTFATRLAEATGLPVETLDERWTTREAERALAEAGPRSAKRRRRDKGKLDAMAAALILRTWLERSAAAGPPWSRP